MNKEIEAQYDAVLNCSTLTDLKKIEDELLMTRCLLINYHNICFDLKQALIDIRELIKKDSIEIDGKYTEVCCSGENFLQIIDKVLGGSDG